MTAVAGPFRPPWRRGNEIAVLQGSSCWDYDDLARRSLRRARDLASQGLTPGQVVMAPVAPALDFLVMQHALARLRCGIFPVSFRSSDARRNALAASASVEWIWRPRPGRDALESTGLRIDHRSESQVPAALLLETSGSEGAPKAVMLTLGNILTSARMVAERTGLGAGDRWLCCLPRHHVGGLMIAYRCALAGAAILLHERFDAAGVARDLERRRVTHLSLVPPMLAQLLAVAKVPPRSLRSLVVGGQSLSPVLARNAIESGWPLQVTYGMTETASQIATSDVLTTDLEEGYAGSPLPGMQVRCAGGRASPGRIRIRGATVMAGYANPDRRPGDGLENDWLVTKDLGYLSGSGGLRVVGRADEVVLIGGEMVIPGQVEAKMKSVPGLDSVVVVVFENPFWGHSLVAVYAGGICRDELDRWCRHRLAGCERPRAYLRLTALPVLESGKTDRRRARALAAASLSSLAQATTRVGDRSGAAPRGCS